MTADIAYFHWRESWGVRESLPSGLAENAASVCEIGAGASPLLPPRSGYVLLDISESELAKAGDQYQAVVANICDPDFKPPNQFDLVFSLSTAEHITDPRLFHENVRRMLRPGGRALHFFPTLYASPFIANRILGERTGEWLLLRIDPGRVSSGCHGKFPAYYRWCRGPTNRQMNRLAGCGYEIERYYGYFGHGYYRPLGLQPLVDRMSHWLARHPVPSLTSYALVLLKAR